MNKGDNMYIFKKNDIIEMNTIPFNNICMEIVCQ